MKQLRSFALFLVLVSLVAATPALAQVNFEVPLTVTNDANVNTLYFGVLTGGTVCIIGSTDTFNGHTEAELPPNPPAGVFDTRFISPASGYNACFGNGSLVDFRPFLSTTQRDTFRVQTQYGPGLTMILSWPSNLNTRYLSATLRYFDQNLSANVNVDMLAFNSADVTAANGSPVTIYTYGPIPPPSPGPIFSAPASVAFGNCNLGAPAVQHVVVQNTGITNALNISAISLPSADWAIVPTTATIPATGSQDFTVTFTPTSTGAVAGNIGFTHDGIAPGPTGTTNVGVSATVISNALLFRSHMRTHTEDATSYRDTLSLAYQGPDPMKALQLRLVLAGNGVSGLSLQGVNRGADLPAGVFSFASQMHYGGANPDGTRNDTVSIVIYGTGNNTVPAGSTLTDFIEFRYGVGHVSPNGSQLVHPMLLDVAASNPDGIAVGLSADVPQDVTIEPRGVNGYQYGDVNHDGSIDILDLLLIQDCILGRTIVGVFDSVLANIAPWGPGSVPAPDGVINVQDLALEQKIILTGLYPDGSPSSYGSRVPDMPVLAKGSPLSPGMEVKLTIYISKTGIVTWMESVVPVKGLQLEFAGVPSVPSDMKIATALGEGYFYNADNLMRVLMYDSKSEVVAPGNFKAGSMPFALDKPDDVTLSKYVVASAQNTRISKVEVEIVKGEDPAELPVNYMLSQNFPNPFNPSTNVTFSVPELSQVTLKIYNVLGEEVQTLFSDRMDRGTKTVEWDGHQANGSVAPSGMYVVRMTAGSFVQSRKMMLLK